MANIRRTNVLTAAADGTCVAIALGAMWTMLAASFDSRWSHVALMHVLWLAAIGTTYLLLVPPQGGDA
jgi:hypothetical protein